MGKTLDEIELENRALSLKEVELASRALALKSRRLRNPHNVTDTPSEAQTPNIGGMVASAGKSLTTWAGSGFSTSSKDEIDARLSLCKACEFWDSAALNGTGRCLKCGCSTWAKIRMASEKCPIDKW